MRDSARGARAGAGVARASRACVDDVRICATTVQSTATVANTVPTKFTFTSYTVAMPMPSMSGTSVSFTASGARSPPMTVCWSRSVTGMHASFESWYMPTVLCARFKFMKPTEPSEPSAILYTPEKLASL